ncbi:glucokinase [Uliginosibacterium sediminicola]|uniref:Glucokinase n=1 Tax=Uliginosibacterium sediminicola TaxID=2024550 RepID=A0ABU9Z2M6_9RHOO
MASNTLSTHIAGDIGGTNARFARITLDGKLDQIQILRCADYAGPAEALAAYLAASAGPAPTAAAIGIANPINGDQVQMTNHSWHFSIEAMRQQIGLQSLDFLNDFTALALSLSQLQDSDRLAIGGGVAQAKAAIGVIGPGTGLGVSGLIPCKGGYAPIEGEGGHASIAGQTPEELAVIAALYRKFPHVSSERAVSGTGLPSLHQALAEVRGQHAAVLTPPEIAERALDGSDPLCVACMQMFCCLLGTAAANLALTLGARGGIYIGGGIVPRLAAHGTQFFQNSGFRQRFENKGRFSDYLAAIPTWIITADTPALLGAAAFLQQR